MKFNLDFETRSKIDLTKVGPYRYATDPSTEVLCVAWSRSEFRTPQVTSNMDVFYGETKELADTEIHAFNAYFEYCIWKYTLKFPVPPITQWRDTAAACLMKSLPRSMDEAAKAIGLKQEKDQEGYRLMMKMCKPLANGEWHNNPKDLRRLMEYCAQDVIVEQKLSRKVGVLPPDEQKIWETDVLINEGGIKVDQEVIQGIIDLKDPIKDELTQGLKSKYSFGPSQVQKIKDWMKENGYQVPVVKKKSKGKMVDKETLDGKAIKGVLAKHPKAEHPELNLILTSRREWATTSLAKMEAAQKALAFDGRIHDQFMYHGANTGRWSGKIVQFHNLPRGEFDEDWMDDYVEAAAQACIARDRKALDIFDNGRGEMLSPMNVLKSVLRGMVIPEEGHVLRVLDYAQIEARMLAWLAGQEDVLEAFRQNIDLYKLTASQIYGVDIKDVTKALRFIGKVASLALGYQGGANAFTSMAVNYGQHIEKEVAEEVKDKWRKKNYFIRRFWYKVEEAAIRCVSSGLPLKYREVGFEMKQGFFTIILPSGRRLWYYDPKVKMHSKMNKEVLTYMGSDYQNNIRWARISTYGGRLTENICQAASRDLLALSIVRLSDMGYKIPLHVHDELVAECPVEFGSMAEMEQVMTDLPSWAEGLPVGVDGFEGTRYRK